MSASSKYSLARLAWFCLLVMTISLRCPSCNAKPYIDEKESWLRQGREDLIRAIRASRRHNENLARNVILFIGDGMGISTVTAARIRDGQLRGESGEDNFLWFERFPHVGLTKTYSVDGLVTDSAAAGTSIMTGVKTNLGVLGCDSRIRKENCTGFGEEVKLKTILHAYMDEGLSTGVVTNSRITHATPASAYAQTPSRSWEGDVDMPEDDESCNQVKDIAQQLVLGNKDIKVVLGGGRRYFLDNTTADPVTGVIGSNHRRDGLNLIEEWEKDKETRNANYSYVWSREGLDNVNSSSTDFLLGLFNPSHFDFEADDENRTQPTLEEMTRKAIEILSKDEKGFFLMVEGARIDFGHHYNSAITALTETIELDKAVKAALEMTNHRDTLIIVTADHSHPFAIQGYAERGSDILGKAEPADLMAPLDGLPYTTLGYTNGPVYGRQDITNVDTTTETYRQPGCIPFGTETHAGEDVSVYAFGPMAHLFHSVHDQNYLYHVMEYAACVGHSRKYCANSKAHSRTKNKE